MKQRHSKADVKAFDKLGSEMRGATRKAGFLMKRGGNHQNWKRRWCILSSLGLGYVPSCTRAAQHHAVTYLTRVPCWWWGCRARWQLLSG